MTSIFGSENFSVRNHRGSSSASEHDCEKSGGGQHGGSGNGHRKTRALMWIQKICINLARLPLEIKEKSVSALHIKLGLLFLVLLGLWKGWFIIQWAIAIVVFFILNHILNLERLLALRTTVEVEEEAEMESQKVPPFARVKSVQFSPIDPSVVLVGYYTGHVLLWDQGQGTARSVQVMNTPNYENTRAIRSVNFLPEQPGHIIACCDDGNLHLLNSQPLKVIQSVKAHDDYIRSIDVKDSLILTSSDDMSIKLWHADDITSPLQCFRGHLHYVMMVRFHPCEKNCFVSASLDRTVRVWKETSSENGALTLELDTPLLSNEVSTNIKCIAQHSFHDLGVNCIEFSGEKGDFIISGSDDGTFRVTDWRTMKCIYSSKVHAHNINSICIVPGKELIIVAVEDGSFGLFNLEGNIEGWKYEAIFHLNDNNCPSRAQRVWSLAVEPKKLYDKAASPGAIDLNICLGSDAGVINCVLKINDDMTGKIVNVNHSNILAERKVFRPSSNQSGKEVKALNTSQKEYLQLVPLGETEAFPCLCEALTVHHNCDRHIHLIVDLPSMSKLEPERLQFEKNNELSFV